ncbi:MAG: hypothetical protein M3P08_13345 [Thermoproteota archaeon]|nr:hypothetical protein [Thermoproteota archaeon]
MIGYEFNEVDNENITLRISILGCEGESKYYEMKLGHCKQLVENYRLSDSFRYDTNKRFGKIIMDRMEEYLRKKALKKSVLSTKEKRLLV